MTTYYVGLGGNDGNDGLSWANRFLTLSGAEDEPVAAGDIVYVAPGVYRETLTIDVSGGNPYSTGTISVTKGSTAVEGVGGMDWTGGNANAGGYFHIRLYAYGTDGDTNADNTFSSAAGNFQANMVGCPIQINTLGAYTIATVVDTDNITLADPNGLGWPADDDTLTYSVMSGEGHHEIASITDADTLELVQPWQGRTLTGLAYVTFDAISYIADVSGESTDNVGGVVRITGSDNDQTPARANCIVADDKDYRMFRGFRCDGTSSHQIATTTGCRHWIVEDCTIEGSKSDAFVYIGGADQLAFTVRRCVMLGGSRCVELTHSAAVNDTGHVFELCNIIGAAAIGIYCIRVGGFTVRNCSILSCYRGVDVTTSGTTGQIGWVSNNILAQNALRGVEAATLGDIIEDYNAFSENGTDRSNVGVGANSQAYYSFFALPILHAGDDQLSGFRFPPPLLGELSEWSPIAAIAGVDERNADLLGTRRPVTAARNSWGALQFTDAERETGTKQAGSVSIALHDAGVHQKWVPVANESTTISVYVYREANYAGTNPSLVIKQPGVADDITIDVAAASQWNLLTTTLTPAATPPYVVAELISENTANAGNYKCFFDTLVVS